MYLSRGATEPVWAIALQKSRDLRVPLRQTRLQVYLRRSLWRQELRRYTVVSVDNAKNALFCGAVTWILSQRLLHKITNSGAIFIARLHVRQTSRISQETQYLHGLYTHRSTTRNFSWHQVFMAQGDDERCVTRCHQFDCTELCCYMFHRRSLNPSLFFI